MRFYLGVDVGTRSARAGIFDDAGTMHASAAREIQVFRPAPQYAEHSSEDIWRAVCEATRAALAEAKLQPESISGIGSPSVSSSRSRSEKRAKSSHASSGGNANAPRQRQSPVSLRLAPSPIGARPVHPSMGA